MFSRMRHTTSVTPASDMSSMGMEKYQSLVKNVTTGDVSANMRKPQQVRGELDRTRYYRFDPLYRALRAVARGKPTGPKITQSLLEIPLRQERLSTGPKRNGLRHGFNSSFRSFETYICISAPIDDYHVASR